MPFRYGWLGIREQVASEMRPYLSEQVASDRLALRAMAGPRTIRRTITEVLVSKENAEAAIGLNRKISLDR